MSLDSEISALKRRIDQAALDKVKAELRHEAALEQHAEALRVLKDSFGLDSLDQVRDKLAELQTRAESLKADVEALLDKHNL